MTSPHGSPRQITRAFIVAGICLLAALGLAGPATAAPYPPLPPVGRVPAIDIVPAPQIAQPVAPGFRVDAGTVAIAPGSYPVAARTGAGPTASTSHRDTDLAGLLTLAAAGIGIGLVVTWVRRARRMS